MQRNTIPRWAKPALFAFAVLVKLASNLYYFQAHGFPASPGADIWFFAGVAQGAHHIFWGDPLQWVLPLFGSCQPTTLYLLLLVFSNVLSLLSLWILFATLKLLYADEGAALWGCAIYVCLSSSVIFCTGSFHHQQESLLVIMLVLWAAVRFSHARKEDGRGRWGIAVILLSALGLCVGPDMLVVLAAAVPCIMVLRLRRIPHPQWMEWLIMLGYLALLVAARPCLYEWGTHLAQNFRGIDLRGQMELRVLDLLPLSLDVMNHTYPLIGCAVVVLAVVALYCGRIFAVSLLACGVIFATLAGRFFFIVEVGATFLVAWTFSNILGRNLRRQSVAGVLGVGLLLGLDVAHGLDCAYPSTICRVLSEMQKDPRPNKKVFCTPTYGFLIQSFARAMPTSDMHHLDARWVEKSSGPSWDAIAYFKVRGVTHIFLTSYDFQLAVRRDAIGNTESGTICSGGFEKHVPKLSDSDLEKSLVYRVLNGDRPVPGTSVVSIQTDPSTRMKVVLLRLE